jgi:transcriptional regulator with XRE-family HTH domain
MTMHVDSKRIRAEREQRAWSQEHLASAAGVSLRTVQRVEGTGLASYDTAQAVAAVFGIDVAELRVAPPVATVEAPSPARVAGPPSLTTAPPAPAQAGRARRYWGIAASLALVTAALFGRVAHADEVQLDVGLSVNEQQLSRHWLVTAEGRDAEIRLEGQMKVVVVPTVASDGNIALSIRMYEVAAGANGEFTLVSEPKLLAADNDEVEVRLTSKRGNVFRVAIKPHKVD